MLVRSTLLDEGQVDETWPLKHWSGEGKGKDFEKLAKNMTGFEIKEMF